MFALSKSRRIFTTETQRTPRKSKGNSVPSVSLWLELPINPIMHAKVQR
jgi:hypothetical protein